MGFRGEEDLDGGRWEAVEMVLWVRVVDTLMEDFCGVVEGGVMISWGDDNAGEGSLGGNEVMPVSGALGGLESSLEGVSEEAFRGIEGAAKDGSSEAAGEVGKDSEHMGDRGGGREGEMFWEALEDLADTSEGAFWIEGVGAVNWELGGLGNRSEEAGASGRRGLADFLCLDLGEG